MLSGFSRAPQRCRGAQPGAAAPHPLLSGVAGLLLGLSEAWRGHSTRGCNPGRPEKPGVPGRSPARDPAAGLCLLRSLAVWSGAPRCWPGSRGGMRRQGSGSVLVPWLRWEQPRSAGDGRRALGWRRLCQTPSCPLQNLLLAGLWLMPLALLSRHSFPSLPL